MNDYNDDVNSKGQQSLLAIAIYFKPAIVSECGKETFFNLLTFLLEKGSKIAYDIEEHLFFEENILVSVMYQTNFKQKTRDGSSNSGHSEQHEEINMDLVKFLIDANGNDKYEFRYDWKKFDKIHCMALHCVASGNLEIFKYLLNGENIFGMKKLSWNKKVPPIRELDRGYFEKECKTLFQYCVSVMGYDKRDGKIAVEFGICY